MARILVADDHPLITSLVSRVLTPEGHILKTAGDGQEAEAMYHEFLPDLVLTDVYMPKQDGLQLLRKLRAINPSVPVILMVGSFAEYPGMTTLDLARSSGANLVLEKPFAPADLLKAVGRLLGR